MKEKLSIVELYRMDDEAQRNREINAMTPEDLREQLKLAVELIKIDIELCRSTENRVAAMMIWNKANEKEIRELKDRIRELSEENEMMKRSFDEGDRVHETQVDYLHGYIEDLQSEIGCLTSQVELLKEEKEQVWELYAEEVRGGDKK